MTALENLLVAQHVTLMAATGFGIGAVLGLSRYPAAERAGGGAGAALAASATGLLDRADDPAGALPYGAQRRLEIARAMCTEPGAALPGRAGRRPQPARIATSWRGCCSTSAARAPPLLLIEHDMGVVMRISDRVVVLDHGKLIADGAPGRGAGRPRGDRRLSRRGRRGRGGGMTAALLEVDARLRRLRRGAGADEVSLHVSRARSSR